MTTLWAETPGIAEEVERRWARDPGDAAWRRHLLAVLRGLDLPRATVLDAGCGLGWYHRALVPDWITEDAYLGVDASPSMLALAAARSPTGHFQQADIFALPFADRQFDLTLCFEVLSHCRDIAAPIRELLRVTRHALVCSLWIASDGKRRETIEIGGVPQIWYTVADVLRAFGCSIDIMGPPAAQPTWPWMFVRRVGA